MLIAEKNVDFGLLYVAHLNQYVVPKSAKSAQVHTVFWCKYIFLYTLVFWGINYILLALLK